jgi:hypothetical protein
MLEQQVPQLGAPTASVSATVNVFDGGTALCTSSLVIVSVEVDDSTVAVISTAANT